MNNCVRDEENLCRICYLKPTCDISFKFVLSFWLLLLIPVQTVNYYAHYLIHCSFSEYFWPKVNGIFRKIRICCWQQMLLFVRPVYAPLIWIDSKIRTARIYQRSVDKMRAVTGCSLRERGLPNWWFFSVARDLTHLCDRLRLTQYEINPIRGCRVLGLARGLRSLSAVPRESLSLYLI